MRSQLLLLALFCSMARSQTSGDDDEKALAWLTQLYQKQLNAKEDKPIGNRIVANSGVNLTPSGKTKSKQRLCDTQTQEEGVCTKRTKCNKEAPKVDPTTSFILRESDPCHYLEVCCPVSKVRATPRKAEATIQEGCGYSHPGAGVFREKTGTSKSGYADYGEFPWMVALLKTGEQGWKDENALGGGTIIHPSVVMTAAHKVYGLEPQELKCRAGEWDTQSENEVYLHQERDVQKIIIHEEYFSVHVHNDIALLILKKPFDPQPHVGVACLSQTLPPPGTECYGMGWGEDFTKGNKYANVLKKITLPLVEHKDCESRFRNSRLGSRYTLHRSLTCAGGEALVDTCIGDGGASLVCPVGSPNDLRYAVVGMVAYGLECGTANIPGVYVNVPEQYDWVGRQMTREGFNRSAYEPGLDAPLKLRDYRAPL